MSGSVHKTEASDQTRKNLELLNWQQIYFFSVIEETDQEHFYVAIKNRPILALNLFILAFNWFVSCHNLYGLVLVSLTISKCIMTKQIIGIPSAQDHGFDSKTT